MSGDRPNFLQYLGYSYGKVLPKSMHDWVIQDLGGPGASLRMTMRFTIPTVLGLALLWLIPADLYTHIGMTLPILLPFIFFAVVLNPVYRRHRMDKHGLDPALADWSARERDYAERNEYESRYNR